MNGDVLVLLEEPEFEARVEFDKPEDITGIEITDNIQWVYWGKLKEGHPPLRADYVKYHDGRYTGPPGKEEWLRNWPKDRGPADYFCVIYLVDKKPVYLYNEEDLKAFEKNVLGEKHETRQIPENGPSSL